MTQPPSITLAITALHRYAARAVLNGQATAVPKSANGTVGMIRLVKVAKDVASKGAPQ